MVKVGFAWANVCGKNALTPPIHFLATDKAISNRHLDDAELVTEFGFSAQPPHTFSTRPRTLMDHSTTTSTHLPELVSDKLAVLELVQVGVVLELGVGDVGCDPGALVVGVVNHGRLPLALELGVGDHGCLPGACWSRM